MSEEKAPYHPRRASDHTIIVRALELLKSGILSSILPNKLFEEFGIGAVRARELAGRAIEIHKNPGRGGKLGTKPLDKPGE